ncbi:serine palmitoyltransferase small subunit A [Calypte anna]|uniref:serine palmitoyltransferase small subunit A n=1 Tax=Calypte anna TaxID=9244 RepID=UPI0011C3BFD8|nr:serine palmitoyltransferase small subunit A [Calypte anna]
MLRRYRSAGLCLGAGRFAVDAHSAASWASRRPQGSIGGQRPPGAGPIGAGGRVRAAPASAGPGPGAGPLAGGESAGRVMALGSAWKQMSWLYYQYLLVTALYMLEPWERTVFNSMLVSIVGMALYTGYVFMPQHIMAILHYFEIVQ